MKFVYTTIWILLLVSFCFAQDAKSKKKSNSSLRFNGTWVLNRSKSDTGLDKGPLVFKEKPEFLDATLVIVQTESEICVTENGETESSIYDLNGEASSIAGKTKSNISVKLKKRKLTIISFIPLLYKIGGKTAQMEKKEIWTVSKDGKTLKQKISWKAPFGASPAPSVKVFNKEM